MIKTSRLEPPPSPDARLMNVIRELNILADEYRIVYRGIVYTKEPKDQ
jgi:hypothetical protein